MGRTSLPIKVALVLSLTFATSYSTATSAFSLPPIKFRPLFSSLPSPPSPPKATASNLLSLLGTSDQASSINAQEAQDLRSCFKFLVPFSPSGLEPEPISFISRRGLGSSNCNRRRRIQSREEENELIWWPPSAVVELARLAVDSGGDPGSVHRALDPTVFPVPDVEGSKEDRCELTRTPYGRRFINEDLNSYLEFLFEMIVARGPSVGLNVSLSRFDLFHGHLFIAPESRRLGILFHAKEYPAYDKELFPYNMGYCQIGSNVSYDDSMNLRNILWLAPLPSNSTEACSVPGVLVVLDAHPGGIIYRDIIPEYVNFARTIYEDDFGEVVVDVNYLNIGEEAPRFQIFIC